MLRPLINMTLDRARPATPLVVVDARTVGSNVAAAAHLLAAQRRAEAAGTIMVEAVSRPAHIRPERCCVFCGHDLYVPPKTTQVRCPVCSRELSVVDVVLRGDVQKADEIITAGRIDVSIGARVAADLVGCSVEISGKVLGDVLASQLCRVRCTAKVSGRILCRQLIVEPGAEVTGIVETITG
ncbi:MAG TPA: polymer-forming cytoskeletal protein [Phycisphaerae bacterium]|nr:polymer-forming cytoskeletal protein [Phycisphaerae bacterium]